MERLLKNPYDANKFYGKHSYDRFTNKKVIADAKLLVLMKSFGFEPDYEKNSFPSPMYIVLNFDTLTWSCYSSTDDTVHRESISRKALKEWIRKNPHRFTSKKFGL